MNKTGCVFMLFVLMMCSGCGKMISMNMAILNGDISKIDALIASGYDINKGEPLAFGHTALMLASFWGKTETVKALFDRGADVNIRDHSGATVLMYAVFPSRSDNTSRTEFGAYLEIIDLLVARGADVNAKDELGTTALMIAAANDEKELAKRLIERSADIGAKNENGVPAWIFAVLGSYSRKRAPDPAILKMLETPEAVLPADAAFLFLPMDESVRVFEDRAGWDVTLKDIATKVGTVFSRNIEGKNSLARIAVLKPGRIRFKAVFETVSDGPEPNTRRTISSKEPIRIPLEAIGGSSYMLNYAIDTSGYPTSFWKWKAWIEEIVFGDRPAAGSRALWIDVRKVERTGQDPEGLTHPRKLGADNEYWLVALTLENASGQALELSAPDPRVHLADRAGLEIPSVDLILTDKIDVMKKIGETLKSTGVSSDFKFSTKIAAGEKKIVTYVFEVPKALAGNDFELHLLDAPPHRLK